MKSGNPILRKDVFNNFEGVGVNSLMTVGGTVNKTFFLFALVLIGCGYNWFLFNRTGSLEALYPWMIGGILGGLIISFVLMFKQSWAPVLAPAYAILEGLAIGGISMFFEAQYPGIVIQAVGLTFGAMFSMLFVYKLKIIEVTPGLRSGIIMATFAIFIVYMASWILSFFGMGTFLLQGSSLLSIGVSIFIVGIATLNLLLDFDLISSGAKAGAPKYMEWYGAFALMVTLIWLYLEILRLLAKLKDR